MTWLICIFLQTSEGTPTVTGWFEVSVGGKLIHSKKVNYCLKLFPDKPLKSRHRDYKIFFHDQLK